MTIEMATNEAWIHSARQYRPSYSYKYAPVPHSSSMIFSTPVGEAWPSNHVVPSPATDFPTDLATHRRLRAAKLAADANRRRTDTSFPDPGHSAPTVANSSLTASVSSTDLSQPTPKPQRSRFAILGRGYTPSRPSRIPTPVFDTRGIATPSCRYLSTPLKLPSHNAKKENIPPHKPLRLLGPISPTRQQSAIPKSRTMGMLSSLTSSFSRSTLNLNSTRQVSGSSTRTSEATTSTSYTSSPPLPTFTTNLRQVHTAQPSSYWCGRFQALAGNFQSERLEECTHNPDILALYIPTREDSPPLSNITNSHSNSKFRDRGRERIKQRDSCEQLLKRPVRTQEEVDKLMNQEEEKRNKRVLAHLEALCVTNEARKSFREWQVAYARTARNEKYLPRGGRMNDQEKNGWVSRMGRAIGGMSTSGTISSLGRRSGLSALGRRKESVMGLEQVAKNRPLGEVF